MAHWLCHRRLAVGAEVLVKPVSGQQAGEARDALAKSVYGQLFAWVVRRLNTALRAQGERPQSFIGVLDIYGSVLKLKSSLQNNTSLNRRKLVSLVFDTFSWLACCSPADQPI